MAKHVWENNTHGYAVLLIIAVFCFTLAILTPPALCADIPVSETAVETPTSDETQKPGGTEKTDDAKKTDEPSQTGKTDESGEATEIKVDLTKLSIEELMNIEITSVSKRPEQMWDAASAIYVITQEDIRQSGLTSIPELLRMVPGLQVAKINSSEWVITSRGFADRFANKLLVLIDGRSVYTELFSGVYWEVEDTFLEDIDRIEVIRGPGATVWGANAVNGVINIITKSAADTQGGSLPIYAGTQERVYSGRYGGKMGKNGYYRFYAKYRNYGAGWDKYYQNIGGKIDVGTAYDSWNQARAGFRMDKDITPNETFTMEGDIYNENLNETYVYPILTPTPAKLINDQTKASGFNVMAKWQMTSPNVQSQFMFYYDHNQRSDIRNIEIWNIFDLEYQQQITSMPRHDIVWGACYRCSVSDTIDTPVVKFTPTDRTLNLISAFIQDDIAFPKSRMHVTIGSKFEHNTYSGFEIEPSIRALWGPGKKKQVVWASISRAVRTPSRADEDMWLDWGVQTTQRVPPFGRIPVIATVSGSPSIISEILLANELGYRIQPTDRIALDLAGFYNIYSDLRSFEMGVPFLSMIPAPHIVQPITMANKCSAKTYGVELSAVWEVTKNWRLDLGYSWLRLISAKDPTSTDVWNVNYEVSSPLRQVQLRSSLSLPKNLEFDAALYCVSGVRNGRSSSIVSRVDPYNRLDLRLAYRPNKDIELSIGVNNALQPHHLEYFPYALEVATEVRRNWYAKATWTF